MACQSTIGECCDVAQLDVRYITFFFSFPFRVDNSFYACPEAGSNLAAQYELWGNEMFADISAVNLFAPSSVLNPRNGFSYSLTTGLAYSFRWLGPPGWIPLDPISSGIGVNEPPESTSGLGPSGELFLDLQGGYRSDCSFTGLITIAWSKIEVRNAGRWCRYRIFGGNSGGSGIVECTKGNGGNVVYMSRNNVSEWASHYIPGAGSGSSWIDRTIFATGESVFAGGVLPGCCF
jgi:hypothetical protein